MRFLLYPDWLIDGSGDDAREGVAVLVNGATIEAVGPARELATMPGVTAIRWENGTLLPGLINNHVHLNLPGDNTPMLPWIDNQSDASLALWAVANASASLAAGITTVRDCGGRGTTVLDTRNALGTGLVGGAAIISCGWPLTITGGHTRPMGGEVDGVDGVRRMVRQLVSLGVDYIKVMAAGGGTPGSLPQYPSFTPEELRAIVETAHDLGRKVAMHCIATASIDRAVAAGADMIEHASFYAPDLVPRFDEAVAARLAQSGIPVTPTLQVARDLIDLQSPADDLVAWGERRDAGLEFAAGLREMGVTLLAGSDAGWRATAFSTFWKELDELTKVGMSPVQAVAAATGAPARVLGIDGRIGTLAPGLQADLVVVDGNVAVDIGCLRHVRAIFQAGLQVASPA
ncbi:MAG: amidohydrolase family protein [Thermomicrobiales bacterium]